MPIYLGGDVRPHPVAHALHRVLDRFIDWWLGRQRSEADRCWSLGTVSSTGGERIVKR